MKSTELRALYEANKIYGGVSAMLWSSPGYGKTSMVKKLAKMLGVKVVTLIGSIMDPTDLGGVPVVSQVKITNPDGTESQKPVLDYAYLNTLEPLQEEGNILFVDELTTCPPYVQAALLQIILDGKFNSLSINPKTFRIGAGNFTTMYGTNKVNPALMNRFVHLFITPDPTWFAHGLLSGFSEYVEPKMSSPKNREKDYYNVIKAISDFVLNNPAYCGEAEVNSIDNNEKVAFPSYRSWEFVAKTLSVIDRDENPSSLVRSIACGCVGKEVGIQFLNFLSTYSYSGIDVESYIGHPQDFELPEDISVEGIKRLMASAVYFFKKKPVEMYPVLAKISNDIFDNGNDGIVGKYIIPIVKELKEKVYKSISEFSKFKKDFKWSKLLKYESVKD